MTTSEYEIPEIELGVVDLEPNSAEREAAILEASQAWHYLGLIENDIVDGRATLDSLDAAVEWVRASREELSNTQ